MKDYSKFNIEIRQGKHLIKVCENPIGAAVELKRLCPFLKSNYVLRQVYKNLGYKSVKNYENTELLKSGFCKIGGFYHLKMVLKVDPLKKFSEIQLITNYKSSQSIKQRDRIFTEFVSRYKGFLKNQANRMYTSVPIDFFAFDFEDCEYEAMYCMKLAIEYMDFSKVGEKFDASKFNISYYVGRQMDARISSYWWKYNKKQKRSVTAQVHDFSVQNDDGGNYSDIVEDPRCLETESDSRMLFDKLDSMICEKQKMIKQFLMEGFKESKIRSLMKINEAQFNHYKSQLKTNMVKIGLVV